jgi:hypothetical protein
MAEITISSHSGSPAQAPDSVSVATLISARVLPAAIPFRPAYLALAGLVWLLAPAVLQVLGSLRGG